MRQLKLFLTALVGAVFFADAAHAYIGPGLGAGVIGTVIAVIGAVFLALFAIMFYPIKRMLKRRKAAAAEADMQNDQ